VRAVRKFFLEYAPVYDIFPFISQLHAVAPVSPLTD